MREWEASFAFWSGRKREGVRWGEVRWFPSLEEISRLGSYVEVMIENWRFVVIIEGRVKTCIVALKLIYYIFNLNEFKKISFAHGKHLMQWWASIHIHIHLCVCIYRLKQCKHIFTWKKKCRSLDSQEGRKEKIIFP